MKLYTRYLVVFFVFLSFAGSSQKKAGKNKAPNIILILADDQGWSQSSVRMDPRIAGSSSNYLETPNIAAMAGKGMRFTNGYSPAPLCTPTRRSILNGTSAPRSGEEFASDWVPANHATIPRLLKQANPNYKAAHIGKWGEQMISTPEECGYDISSGMTGNKDGNLKVSGDPKSGPLGKVGEKEYYTTDDPKATDLLTNSAIQFIQQQAKAGSPFYLQVSYYATHLDVVAREKTIAKYTKKGEPDRGYTPAWAAMLEELDNGVGRLLAAVDKAGISDNTYIIYTTDNGGRPTIPGGTSAVHPNLPLSGAKHSLLEGGIRVPFIVRGPGIKAGSVCNTPVVGYDFLPTFYDLAGGKKTLDKEIDGGSIRGLFTNPKGGVKRTENALYFSRPDRGFSAIRKGDYKLMLYWNAKGEIGSRRLFQININPTEEGSDIAMSNPQKADELQKLLLNYLKSVNAKTVKSGKRPIKDD